MFQTHKSTLISNTMKRLRFKESSYNMRLLLILTTLLSFTENAFAEVPAELLAVSYPPVQTYTSTGRLYQSVTPHELNHRS